MSKTNQESNKDKQQESALSMNLLSPDKSSSSAITLPVWGEGVDNRALTAPEHKLTEFPILGFNMSTSGRGGKEAEEASDIVPQEEKRNDSITLEEFEAIAEDIKNDFITVEEFEAIAEDIKLSQNQQRTKEGREEHSSATIRMEVGDDEVTPQENQNQLLLMPGRVEMVSDKWRRHKVLSNDSARRYWKEKFEAVVDPIVYHGITYRIQQKVESEKIHDQDPQLMGIRFESTGSKISDLKQGEGTYEMTYSVIGNPIVPIHGGIAQKLVEQFAPSIRTVGAVTDQNAEGFAKPNNQRPSQVKSGGIFFMTGEGKEDTTERDFARLLEVKEALVVADTGQTIVHPMSLNGTEVRIQTRVMEGEPNVVSYLRDQGVEVHGVLGRQPFRSKGQGSEGKYIIPLLSIGASDLFCSLMVNPAIAEGDEKSFYQKAGVLVFIPEQRTEEMISEWSYFQEVMSFSKHSTGKSLEITNNIFVREDSVIRAVVEMLFHTPKATGTIVFVPNSPQEAPGGAGKISGGVTWIPYHEVNGISIPMFTPGIALYGICRESEMDRLVEHKVKLKMVMNHFLTAGIGGKRSHFQPSLIIDEVENKLANLTREIWNQEIGPSCPGESLEVFDDTRGQVMNRMSWSTGTSYCPEGFELLTLLQTEPDRARAITCDSTVPAYVHEVRFYVHKRGESILLSELTEDDFDAHFTDHEHYTACRAAWICYYDTKMLQERENGAKLQQVGKVLIPDKLISRIAPHFMRKSEGEACETAARRRVLAKIAVIQYLVNNTDTTSYQFCHGRLFCELCSTMLPYLTTTEVLIQEHAGIFNEETEWIIESLEADLGPKQDLLNSEEQKDSSAHMAKFLQEVIFLGHLEEITRLPSLAKVPVTQKITVSGQAQEKGSPRNVKTSIQPDIRVSHNLKEKTEKGLNLITWEIPRKFGFAFSSEEAGRWCLAAERSDDTPLVHGSTAKLMHMRHITRIFEGCRKKLSATTEDETQAKKTLQGTSRKIQRATEQFKRGMVVMTGLARDTLNWSEDIKESRSLWLGSYPEVDCGEISVTARGTDQPTRIFNHGNAMESRSISLNLKGEEDLERRLTKTTTRHKNAMSPTQISRIIIEYKMMTLALRTFGGTCTSTSIVITPRELQWRDRYMTQLLCQQGRMAEITRGEWKLRWIEADQDGIRPHAMMTPTMLKSQFPISNQMHKSRNSWINVGSVDDDLVRFGICEIRKENLPKRGTSPESGMFATKIGEGEIVKENHPAQETRGITLTRKSLDEFKAQTSMIHDLENVTLREEIKNNGVKMDSPHPTEFDCENEHQALLDEEKQSVSTKLDHMFFTGRLNTNQAISWEKIWSEVAATVHVHTGTGTMVKYIMTAAERDKRPTGKLNPKEDANYSRNHVTGSNWDKADKLHQHPDGRYRETLMKLDELNLVKKHRDEIEKMMFTKIYCDSKPMPPRNNEGEIANLGKFSIETYHILSELVKHMESPRMKVAGFCKLRDQGSNVPELGAFLYGKLIAPPSREEHRELLNVKKTAVRPSSTTETWEMDDGSKLYTTETEDQNEEQDLIMDLDDAEGQLARAEAGFQAYRMGKRAPESLLCAIRTVEGENPVEGGLGVQESQSLIHHFENLGMSVNSATGHRVSIKSSSEMPIDDHSFNLCNQLPDKEAAKYMVMIDNRGEARSDTVGRKMLETWSTMCKGEYIGILSPLFIPPITSSTRGKLEKTLQEGNVGDDEALWKNWKVVKAPTRKFMTEEIKEKGSRHLESEREDGKLNVDGICATQNLIPIEHLPFHNSRMRSLCNIIIKYGWGFPTEQEEKFRFGGQGMGESDWTWANLGNPVINAFRASSHPRGIKSRQSMLHFSTQRISQDVDEVRNRDKDSVFGKGLSSSQMGVPAIDTLGGKILLGLPCNGIVMYEIPEISNPINMLYVAQKGPTPWCGIPSRIHKIMDEFVTRAILFYSVCTIPVAKMGKIEYEIRNCDHEIYLRDDKVRNKLISQGFPSSENLHWEVDSIKAHFCEVQNDWIYSIPWKDVPLPNNDALREVDIETNRSWEEILELKQRDANGNVSTTDTIQIPSEIIMEFCISRLKKIPMFCILRSTNFDVHNLIQNVCPGYDSAGWTENSIYGLYRGLAQAQEVGDEAFVARDGAGKEVTASAALHALDRNGILSLLYSIEGPILIGKAIDVRTPEGRRKELLPAVFKGEKFHQCAWETENNMTEKWSPVAIWMEADTTEISVANILHNLPLTQVNGKSGGQLFVLEESHRVTGFELTTCGFQTGTASGTPIPLKLKDGEYVSFVEPKREIAFSRLYTEVNYVSEAWTLAYHHLMSRTRCHTKSLLNQILWEVSRNPGTLIDGSKMSWLRLGIWTPTQIVANLPKGKRVGRSGGFSSAWDGNVHESVNKAFPCLQQTRCRLLEEGGSFGARNKTEEPNRDVAVESLCNWEKRVCPPPGKGITKGLSLQRAMEEREKIRTLPKQRQPETQVRQTHREHFLASLATSKARERSPRRQNSNGVSEEKIVGKTMSSMGRTNITVNESRTIWNESGKVVSYLPGEKEDKVTLTRKMDLQSWKHPENPGSHGRGKSEYNGYETKGRWSDWRDGHSYYGNHESWRSQSWDFDDRKTFVDKNKDRDQRMLMTPRASVQLVSKGKCENTERKTNESVAKEVLARVESPRKSDDLDEISQFDKQTELMVKALMEERNKNRHASEQQNKSEAKKEEDTPSGTSRKGDRDLRLFSDSKRAEKAKVGPKKGRNIRESSSSSSSESSSSSSLPEQRQSTLKKRAVSSQGKKKPEAAKGRQERKAKKAAKILELLELLDSTDESSVQETGKNEKKRKNIATRDDRGGEKKKKKIKRRQPTSSSDDNGGDSD